MSDEPQEYGSVEEWQEEAVRLFGDDQLDWSFVCPACGYVQSTRDYQEVGAPEGAVGFSCVGRWSGANQEAFEEGEGPCNYCGHGLIQLNPVTIHTEEHGDLDVFAFAETEARVLPEEPMVKILPKRNSLLPKSVNTKPAKE